jgi:5'-deoxy-5'-methylthioadenosine phosphorylase
MRRGSPDTEPSQHLAVIGGSGLYHLQTGASASSVDVQTPYAEAPVVVQLEQTDGGAIWFSPRHGPDHSVAPHLINYRANLWALHHLGVKDIIAVNAVGGISTNMHPGCLVLPDQIIDYSWGREHTFASSPHALDKHVDFTWPYCAALGGILSETAARLTLPLQRGAVYACTQGPRLETAAEIVRLARDGCDIVGMTGMPEAVLARELGLRYACVALVVNRAAGLDGTTIRLADIEHTMVGGMQKIRELLLAAIPQFLKAHASE